MTSSIKYYLFNTSFSDLDLGRGCQDQHKAKSAGFIFFAHFSADQDEICCGVEVNSR